MESLHRAGASCYAGGSARLGQRPGHVVVGGEPAPKAPSAEPSGEADWAFGPGLVSPQTSVTDGSRCVSERPGAVTVERDPARLRRMRRNVRESSRLLQDETASSGFRYWAVFLTFTYAGGDWEPGHITAWVRRAREWSRRLGEPFRYVWVMELHRSGRPHFHAIVWLPRGRKLPMADKRGWWTHGATRTERARSPVGYICKYASKASTGIDGRCVMPPGARLSGSGGLSAGARCVRSWRLCPAWVRELFTVEDRPVRAEGGGWLSRLDGRWEPPRWRLEAHAPDWSWVRFVPCEVAHG